MLVPRGSEWMVWESDNGSLHVTRETGRLVESPRSVQSFRSEQRIFGAETDDLRIFLKSSIGTVPFKSAVASSMMMSSLVTIHARLPHRSVL